jgi:hypothetical protein
MPAQKRIALGATRRLNFYLIRTYEKVENAEKVGMPAQKRIALGATRRLNFHLIHF